jgi:RNA polymerase sigma factor FliA
MTYTDISKTIAEYLPLIKNIAYSLIKGEEAEDFVEIGKQGLVEAIKTFDNSRGVKLSTYAFYKIKGKILEELRDRDWYGISRRLKSNNPPTIVYFEDLLPENIDEILNKDVVNVEDIIFSRENHDILLKALSSLTNREKNIIQLYYFDNFTYDEIGKNLKLSKSSINKIHDKALNKLKIYLTKE